MRANSNNWPWSQVVTNLENPLLSTVLGISNVPNPHNVEA